MPVTNKLISKREEACRSGSVEADLLAATAAWCAVSAAKAHCHSSIGSVSSPCCHCPVGIMRGGLTASFGEGQGGGGVQKLECGVLENAPIILISNMQHRVCEESSNHSHK